MKTPPKVNSYVSVQFSSITQSCPTLRSHELRHDRPPCPSPTQWTWVWVNSGSWWWTGRPGILKFMGSQSRTRLSDWTELNWNSTLTGDWTFHMGYQKPLFLSKFLEVDPTLHFRSFKKTLFFPKVYSKREIWKRKGNIVHNVVSSWKKVGMILHRDQHSNCD